MATTAVVILNYNGEDFLKRFLPSVITHTNAEIIVADNASTDQSVELLRSLFPEIRVIQLEKNLGYAGGYNEALKQVEADYFVLLNSDIEVTENWLNPLISYLESEPTYAACQPKIKDYTHQHKFEYAGAAGGFLDFLGYPFCRGRIFNRIEDDHGQYDEPLDIFWASGACLVIRSKVFFEAGGLDQDFFAHMEEIDLCWRVHSLGYKIKCIPESVIYHVGGGTLSKAKPFKTYLNFRNGLFLLLKNLPLLKALLKVPARVLLDWVAAFKFLLEGNANHSLAVIKAHLSVLLKLVKTLKKRSLVSRAPRSKLMIYEYYLKGNKKFRDL